MRKAADLGLDGFLYIPFAQAATREDLTEHHRLATIYAPLNWIDRTLFGGAGPTQGIMWALTNKWHLSQRLNLWFATFKPSPQLRHG